MDGDQLSFLSFDWQNSSELEFVSFCEICEISF